MLETPNPEIGPGAVGHSGLILGVEAMYWDIAWDPSKSWVASWVGGGGSNNNKKHHPSTHEASWVEEEGVAWDIITAGLFLPQVKRYP